MNDKHIKEAYKELEDLREDLLKAVSKTILDCIRSNDTVGLPLKVLEELIEYNRGQISEDLGQTDAIPVEIIGKRIQKLKTYRRSLSRNPFYCYSFRKARHKRYVDKQLEEACLQFGIALNCYAKIVISAYLKALHLIGRHLTERSYIIAGIMKSDKVIMDVNEYHHLHDDLRGWYTKFIRITKTYNIQV